MKPKNHSLGNFHSLHIYKQKSQNWWGFVSFYFFFPVCLSVWPCNNALQNHNDQYFWVNMSKFVSEISASETHILDITLLTFFI